MSPLEIIKSLNFTFGMVKKLKEDDYELEFIKQRFVEEGCDILGEYVLYEMRENNNNLLKGLSRYPKRIYDLCVKLRSEGKDVVDISKRLNLSERNIYSILNTKEDEYNVLY